MSRGVSTGCSLARACACACAYMVALAGCSTEPGTETETETETETDPVSCEDAEVFAAVVDHHLWTNLDGAADPLADHRPATVECGLAGYYIEDDQLEVDTNFCNYLAVAQPSAVALEQGQCLRLGLYHFDLIAPEPAEAHLAIVIDGQELWSDRVEIPGSANVYDLELASPITAPAGAEVVFHLHNHGQNTWVLQHLEAAQQ